VTACFVEADWANGFFRALVSNSSSWSSNACQVLEMIAAKLTLGFGSNQATTQAPVVGANHVPKTVSD
jgi:hypothetical protein